ncbi:MAG TPA: tryptophan synthase subunit alpha [Acidimicrobiales bacterium]|nr:tryptophan synthase subunit alpha [Acidimicrobiales bacterium]
MADPIALETHLRAQRDAGRKLLVPYVTGGLGKDWLDVVRACADAGADAVEVGIPFSDPVMDGPTIQAASEEALREGTNLDEILDGLSAVDAGVPLVAMTYVNIAFHKGYQRFAAEAVRSGVSGVILPDLPLEEMGEWEPSALEAGLETVLLASPLTPDERLAVLCERSKGYIYGVNLLGVTGERTSVTASAVELAQRLKATTDLPVIMGFGISTPAQAAELAEHADGVIVGSALMRLRLDGASPEQIGALVAELRAALDAG